VENMARVTVEDCLEQVPNRFALIMVSRWRVRQLMKRNNPAPQMVPDTGNKVVVTSLREVAAGHVKIDNQPHQRGLEKSFESQVGSVASVEKTAEAASQKTEDAAKESGFIAEAQGSEFLMDSDTPARSL
jgi:DNA-directed RNA polymerase subunit omega